MLTLSEKQLGHALFFSLKRTDMDHVDYLLSIDAPTSTSYFITQDKITYTQNLMASAVAKIVKKYGVGHARAQQAFAIFDKFCKNKADLRCHCVAKHPHYCAIGEVLKVLTITCPEELVVEQNFVTLVKLVFNGATYKNLSNTKEFIWTALKEVQAFIETRPDLANYINQSNRRKSDKQVRPATCHKLCK